MDLTSQDVYLSRCRDYSAQELTSCCDRLLHSLTESRSLAGSNVLLKPNLISASMGPLACTEGSFIVTVARWFIEQGARVTVGDSPAFGTAEAVLNKIGIVGKLRHLGADIGQFSAVRHILLPSGVRAGLAAEALDCDLLVNLPRVKAHTQLRVTLAVKNYFGCLAGVRKPCWHMLHGGQNGAFSSLLVELLAVLPDSLTLADGVVAMDQTGPMGGKPYPLEILAGSANPVALDRALLDILQVPPAESPLMEAAIDHRIPGTDLASLVFPLASPEELVVEDFVVPQELHPIRFNPFRFIFSSIRRAAIKLGLSS